MTTEEFLGPALRQKYQDIWPVIRLILYRIDASGKTGLFVYEGSYSGQDTSIKHSLINGLRWTIYHGHKKNRKPAETDSILLSSTVTKIDRYLDMLQELYSTPKVITTWTQADIDRSFFQKQNPLQKQILESGRLCLGESVCGKEVKYYASMVYDLFLELAQKGKCCQDEYEQVDAMLLKLQTAVNQRVRRLRAELKRHRVKLFITINQYNLRDALTVMACRQEGIWTKELSHHSNCVVAISKAKAIQSQLLFSDNGGAFAYVNESAQWNEAEKEYCIKYQKFEALYPDFAVTCVGCPEVCKSTRLENQKRYPKENAIIYFAVPTIDLENLTFNYELRDPSEDEKQSALRKIEIIYSGLAQAAKELQAKVYVRYHPTEPESHRPEQEKDLLTRYGFEVLSSSRTNFLMSVCKSKIAVGYNTSAFVTALIYGCKCYNLIWMNEAYDYRGLNITNIPIDEISHITFDTDSTHVNVDALDVNALCAYPKAIDR